MANIVENMSTEAHLAEALRQLDNAHALQRSAGGNTAERVTAAATLAQAHLMMVQLGVDEGRLPTAAPPARPSTNPYR